eukprot:13493053-Alexandrium_andersonii.AAC.1
MAHPEVHEGDRGAVLPLPRPQAVPGMITQRLLTMLALRQLNVNTLTPKHVMAHPEVHEGDRGA